MKSSIAKTPPPPPAFTPVSILLTFESQQELNAFGALFNYCPVADTLDKAGCPGTFEQIAETLQLVGAVISGSPEFITLRSEFQRRGKEGLL